MAVRTSSQKHRPRSGSLALPGYSLVVAADRTGDLLQGRASCKHLANESVGLTRHSPTRAFVPAGRMHQGVTVRTERDTIVERQSRATVTDRHNVVCGHDQRLPEPARLAGKTVSLFNPLFPGTNRPDRQMLPGLSPAFAAALSHLGTGSDALSDSPMPYGGHRSRQQLRDADCANLGVLLSEQSIILLGPGVDASLSWQVKSGCNVMHAADGPGQHSRNSFCSLFFVVPANVGLFLRCPPLCHRESPRKCFAKYEHSTWRFQWR